MLTEQKQLTDEEIEALAENEYYKLFPTSIERSDYVSGFIKGYKAAINSIKQQA